MTIRIKATGQVIERARYTNSAGWVGAFVPDPAGRPHPHSGWLYWSPSEYDVVER